MVVSVVVMDFEIETTDSNDPIGWLWMRITIHREKQLIKRNKEKEVNEGVRIELWIRVNTCEGERREEILGSSWWIAIKW